MYFIFGGRLWWTGCVHTLIIAYFCSGRTRERCVAEADFHPSHEHTGGLYQVTVKRRLEGLE